MSTEPLDPTRTTTGRLRAVVAVPLAEADAKRIVEIEPRLDLIHRPDLLPPMRHPADFSGDPAFSRTPTQQSEYEDMVDSADALYGIPSVDSRALARTVRANPRVRWVHTTAAGGGAQVRAAQLSAAELARVTFTTSAGVHGGPLSEFALFGVLAGAKSLPRLLAQQARREWPVRWPMTQLSDMTIVILGLGGIGYATAELFQQLGADVAAFNRSGSTGAPDGVRVGRMDELSGVLPHADAVVITLPGTASTDGLVDDRFLDLLKPGATLVNVGRGTVVNEASLERALESGRVGFAALDVFANEPLAPTSGLWDRHNVLVSPHTAALDPREERRIAELFARNATRLLDGTLMHNIVDTVEFY